MIPNTIGGTVCPHIYIGTTSTNMTLIGYYRSLCSAMIHISVNAIILFTYKFNSKNIFFLLFIAFLYMVSARICNLHINIMHMILGIIYRDWYCFFE